MTPWVKNGGEYRAASDINLDLTLDCGQCFRWEHSGGVWRGIAGGRYCEARSDGRAIALSGVRGEDIPFWTSYFDLETDYAPLDEALRQYRIMRRGQEGIRILRQPFWEALCSFIISANNNIPRIKGIVRRLCESFGRSVEGGYAFPEPQDLAGLTPGDLDCIRAGFRAGYILDAAKKTASGEIDGGRLSALPYPKARGEIQKIRGVGPKVADCALLFGCHMLESFPEDVWIKRAMTGCFPDGLPADLLPFAGYAQQYIFHNARTGDLLKKVR